MRTFADPIRLTFLVIKALDELGVPYFIGGSLASSLYGLGRSTYDADIIAKLEPTQAEPLTKAVSQDFFADLSMIRDAIQRKGSFNLIHRDTAFKVDVFVAGEGDFDQATFDRRVEQSLEGLDGSIFFSSPEDTILAKLDWYRLGNHVSERQWNDVVEILKAQGNQLDADLLNQWASRLGLTDLLHRAQKEADFDG